MTIKSSKKEVPLYECRYNISSFFIPTRKIENVSCKKPFSNNCMKTGTDRTVIF